MKTYIFIAALLLFPSLAFSEEFLGAPVMPGGKVITQTATRLEKQYDIPYEEALKYYRKVFEKEKDIKFWDRTTETGIEDHSTRKWHSITLIKVDDKRTDMVIIADNWIWIFGTLLLRFIGVFMVLSVLYLALACSGAIFSRLGRSQAEKKN